MQFLTFLSELEIFIIIIIYNTINVTRYITSIPSSFNSFSTHLSDIHVVIAQAEELEVLRGKSPQMLWLEDLDQFLDELEVSKLC